MLFESFHIDTLYSTTCQIKILSSVNTSVPINYLKFTLTHLFFSKQDILETSFLAFY